MDPVLMFILALSLPLMFALLLVGPIYGGMCVALYLFYGQSVKEYFYDPGSIIDLYGTVYNYWQINHELLGFKDFLLPVFGPFALGVLLGGYWCYLFVKYIKNIFHM